VEIDKKVAPSPYSMFFSQIDKRETTLTCIFHKSLLSLTHKDVQVIEPGVVAHTCNPVA
jgi:hypothetical protein